MPRGSQVGDIQRPLRPIGSFALPPSSRPPTEVLVHHGDGTSVHVDDDVFGPRHVGIITFNETELDLSLELPCELLVLDGALEQLHIEVMPFVFYALHDPQERPLSGTIALGGERHLRSMDRLDGWDLPDLVTISNGDRPIGLLHSDGLGPLRVVLAP